jgi:hypothetical protein
MKARRSIEGGIGPMSKGDVFMYRERFDAARLERRW